MARHLEKKQEFVVVYKTGNSKEWPNYRTIAIISHAIKILLLLQILLNRMREKIEMELPDMLVIIQVLIENVMGIGGQSLFTFIDYSKAFDSISHVHLF